MDKVIPFGLSGMAIVNEQYPSMKKLFDTEMRRLDAEMSDFMSILANREKEFFENTSEGHFLDGFDHPLVQDGGYGKSLKLQFDVSHFAPEEVILKTVDNKVVVHAKHQENSDTKRVFREYNREFVLPKCVNLEMINSSLSKDGVLTVEAPVPQLAIPSLKLAPEPSSQFGS